MGATLSTELAAVATDLQAEPDVEHTVQGVLQHAQEVTGGESAGVMIVRGDHVEPMLASTAEAEKADRLQVEHGEGPTMTAVSSDDAIIVDEVSTDLRWPQWRVPAAGLGLHSAVSMRLSTGRRTLGALSLYSARPGAFANEHAETVRLYARHASVAVASALHESGLRDAVDARHVIGQAQGILMERHGLDADTAFAVLRRGSRHRNVKLSEHAAEVINSRRLSE